MEHHEPVDAVVTWVDGYDANHQRKLSAYLAQAGNLRIRPTAVAPTRFNQYGEINYCVCSLLYNAPWIRTIYIVTDNQKPPILQQLHGSAYEAKVKLVDHQEIFTDFEACLPTFNSLSIESVLWRIPGLANHFIYLNDDCFIIRPVSYQHFFAEDQIILQGEWKTQSGKKWRHLFKRHVLSSAPQQANEHRMTQEMSARLAGFNKHFFHLPHAPFFLRKETLAHFFQQFPQLLSQNLGYHLRDLQQFWAVSLAMHLEIQKKKVKFVHGLSAITINCASHSLKKIQKRLLKATNKTQINFLCMQSLDEANELTRAWLLNWLAEIIPDFRTIPHHAQHEGS